MHKRNLDSLPGKPDKQIEEKKIVLFSGRLDPVTPGHIITILRLKRKYGMVKVVILGNCERRWPAQFSKQVLDEVFLDDPSVDISINEIHFGEITQEEILKFMHFDLYAAGNITVLKHVENLKVCPVIFTDRAYEYNASDYIQKESR
jgi:hypothetical protein